MLLSIVPLDFTLTLGSLLSLQDLNTLIEAVANVVDDNTLSHLERLHETRRLCRVFVAEVEDPSTDLLDPTSDLSRLRDRINTIATPHFVEEVVIVASTGICGGEDLAQEVLPLFGSFCRIKNACVPWASGADFVFINNTWGSTLQRLHISQPKNGSDVDSLDKLSCLEELKMWCYDPDQVVNVLSSLPDSTRQNTLKTLDLVVDGNYSKLSEEELEDSVLELIPGLKSLKLEVGDSWHDNGWWDDTNPFKAE
ncbi:UNVERIFIED_CONTAM: hypothetical protein HDU68_002303 [Siphonaria sp. JEL0065]|nr:hypothetical protein HDU68_002303 [Siphonaria sp. JEL0065]